MQLNERVPREQVSLLELGKNPLVPKNMPSPTFSFWLTPCPPPPGGGYGIIYFSETVTVSITDNIPHYIGLTENTFKELIQVLKQKPQRKYQISSGKERKKM